MAAPMVRALRSHKTLRYQQYKVLCRTFFTDEYGCDKIWYQRLERPQVKLKTPKTLGVRILDRFEQNKEISAADVDMYACLIPLLKPEEEYITREILKRFRHSNESYPMHTSIVHSVVRGYIENGQTGRLLELMKDKFTYGIIPDNQAMCILMHSLLAVKDYNGAAKVGYEVMLQEDYDHQLSVLLALYSAICHFKHTMTFERYTPPTPDPDAEDEYIPVKIIRNPFYDDHFDIKDERFLLGKTLYQLAKHSKDLDGPLSRTLQLIGLGLYEKFELANRLLEEWIKDSKNDVAVYSCAVELYGQYLEDAPTRDEDAEEVPMGRKTLDDEIELLKLTEMQKAHCQAQFEAIKSRLVPSLLKDEDIEVAMENLMWSSKIQEYEQQENVILKELYPRWANHRDEHFVAVETERARQTVMDKAQQELEALQEREELLSYFDNIKDIRYYQQYSEKVSKVIEESADYVEAPGERNLKAVKMKKGRK